MANQHNQLVLVLLILIASSSKIDPTKIVVAINCGSSLESVASLDSSYKYQPDKQYISGQSVEVDYQADSEASSADIKYSFERELYMYERHTYKQMTYTLPVKQGKNTLILKFAEMYFKQSGKRVFNIKIGAKVVITDLDIIQKTGAKFAAHQEFIEIDVRKDGVYVHDQKLQKAIQNGKLKLTFSKGKADNPIIQGIIVYHSPIAESPRDQYQKLRNNWESQQEMKKAQKEEAKLKELIKIQNKREKIVIRNDQIVFENTNTNDKPPTHPTSKYGVIRLFLMSPVGIIIWAAAYMGAIWFFFQKVFKFQISNNKSQIAS